MDNLELILVVNNITKKELYQRVKLPPGPLSRIKTYSADNIYPHYSILVELKKAGLKIPYILRPKCRSCASSYCPSTKQQQICSFCKDGVTLEDITLEDALEMNLSATEIKEHLGITDTQYIQLTKDIHEDIMSV